ncbi:glycosyltransferase involved in cell wall biosynthesis [Tamaricihabitans halophyticus]|uniref:Glycosyltransferase involved in cell wall biosynthesis n=1 Tax=Tamaricihabitans halophyticus TaxID=1262583 RepID=A0A4R2Q4P4_9PSEU|nr:glycosyltransferase [Tamaricihabitans halophyticus]TCP41635.1 glycosyltransferase involved in cell wall biosynthesis [Tamaricihabitans halophyticus]
MTASPHRPISADRRKRIVIGADTFAPNVNGAARFAERLAAGLARRGHEIHVLCPSTTTKAQVLDWHGATLHRIASHRTPAHPDFRICMPWRARKDTARLLSELRPDVVHSQAHFLVGRALVNEAARQEIPIVATNHFMPENLIGYVPMPPGLAERASRWAWRDFGKVYGKADVVTTPTQRAVQLLRDNGFPLPVRPVSCGIDADRYPGDGQQVPGTVLFVGRLDEEKHVDELLRAAALLSAEQPIRVELVGDGACRAELTELARRLGIADRVQFHGFVSESDLLAAYARAEVFCMPGIAELQSIATLEAMASGKPIIAANAVALPHLVTEDVNGWLYQPGDIAGLAERLRRVLGTPGESARLGAGSRRLVGRHAIDATLDEFEEIYAEAAGEAARPRLTLATAA